jgi:hypothetical protein
LSASLHEHREAIIPFSWVATAVSHCSISDEGIDSVAVGDGKEGDLAPGLGRIVNKDIQHD